MDIMNQFSISGISCEACIKLISRRVLTIKGVKIIKVSLTGDTSVTAERKISQSEIMKVLEGTEYQVN